jgi:hypothetical protein
MRNYIRLYVLSTYVFQQIKTLPAPYGFLMTLLPNKTVTDIQKHLKVFLGNFGLELSPELL